MIQNRDQLSLTSTHELVMDCIEAGITATQPKNAVRNALDLNGDTLVVGDTSIDLTEYSEILVLGGGKAATQMARAIESVLGDRISDGIVVTNDPGETEHTTVVEGSHPTPNEAGREGAERLLSMAEAADEETLILFPLSGGGSSLLPVPAGDISLADLQSLTEDLLASGASIDEINVVRKHLSRIKGGRLAAAAAPARVVGLTLSDVVGNDLSIIASGPAVGDTSTFADAEGVLRSYDINPPASVERHLQRGLDGDVEETPNPGDPVFDDVETHVLADASTAIDEATAVIEESEFTPVVLSTQVEGEAREVGTVHAAIANEAVDSGQPVEPPVVFVSGGEATVTLRGDGLGGPNQEFVLSGLLSLTSDGVVVGSVDTDGEDGATDAAGALGTREIIEQTERARDALADNDTYDFFAERDALVHTGPTGTNVNDLRIIAVPE